MRRGGVAVGLSRVRAWLYVGWEIVLHVTLTLQVISSLCHNLHSRGLPSAFTFENEQVERG